MHEYSIVQALIDRVADEARRRGATAVHRVSIGIGELAGVEIELLTTAYATFKSCTVCAEAELAVESVPARWECPACARAIAAGAMLQCSDCHVPAALVSGGEITLNRIELEVP